MGHLLACSFQSRFFSPSVIFRLLILAHTCADMKERLQKKVAKLQASFQYSAILHTVYSDDLSRVQYISLTPYKSRSGEA